ncbi:hypothetical protein [Streptomyces cyaneofuscatus]|uniref:Uncharacterized protein n=1 Tax=Streptomyces cyaneofuscatus TaxID=66883 RepID=A0ABZ1F862_9ACTN|nr:hypothetical protein [Streptomyces cyaneofuscatus]WSB12620.1 hypothetical protein OG849_35435 [Streptomyces cyaneofuscatus]WSD51164.1 hypothetical protein OG857_35680 [Streptomyces cyaneofuscatus]WSD51195.1 hypothetical protein OG857_35525 [Streptomyces cyaneofuscatus]
MSDDSPETTSAAPWERTPIPAEHQRLLATVAAHPVVENVGSLADLLAKLPPEMSLWLDEHAREDPANRMKQQFLAVTPRIVGVSNSEGPTGPSMEAGLELGIVHVPFNSSPDERVALATRSDLPPDSAYARAEHRMELGQVPAALGDLASLLRNVAGLLEGATEWMDRNSTDAESLHVEASRINQAAARIGQAAKTIREEDCG